MTNGKTEKLIDRACLLSYFIIVVAFKKHASWAAEPRLHDVLRNMSDLVARGILLTGLSAAALGVLIVVQRIIRFLLSKPSWRISLALFKSQMKEPYEPQPWMNVGYGLLGFLMMPSPFIDLVIGMFLAMLFSVTTRIALTKSSVQKLIGFAD